MAQISYILLPGPILVYYPMTFEDMCPELQRWYQNYARRRSTVIEVMICGSEMLDPHGQA